jgi:hypothetical protein
MAPPGASVFTAVTMIRGGVVIFGLFGVSFNDLNQPMQLRGGY